jgi:tRNA-modifying protein YgfZ
MNTVDQSNESATPVAASPVSVLPRVWYTDPLLDVDALAAADLGYAIYSLGYLPCLVVSGKDRSTWLNGLLTCDVSSVRPGVGAWGLLLDRVGKVQAVLGIVAQVDTLLLGVLWGDVQAVHQQLDMRLVMEDAELDVTADRHWSIWVGKHDERPSDAAAWGDVTLAGPCKLVAEPTFTEGAVHRPLSEAAWALWRMRHALPWGGIDFDGSARPHDASLDRKAVSWSKGCYLGQEVVCMQDMRGKVKKRLEVFTTVGDAFADQAVGGVIRQGGAEIGKVTSAVYEPNDRRWTVFALIPSTSLPEENEARTFAEPLNARMGVETALEWEVAPPHVLPLRWMR